MTLLIIRFLSLYSERCHALAAGYTLVRYSTPVYQSSTLAVGSHARTCAAKAFENSALLNGATAIASERKCFELVARAAVVLADDRRKISWDPAHPKERQATFHGSNGRTWRFFVARFDLIITERIETAYPTGSLDSDVVELYLELERREKVGGELSGVFSHAGSHCAELFAELRRRGQVNSFGKIHGDLMDQRLGQEWRADTIRSWYKPSAQRVLVWRPGDLTVSFATTTTNGIIPRDPL